jgi:polysaccharide export outer membrane protein
MQRLKLYLTTVFFIAVLSGCRSHTLLETEESPPIELKGDIKYEYKMQPFDRIVIYLYKYPDLAASNLTSAEANDDKHDDIRGTMLDSEGELSLPLLGRVKLAGLTQPQASRMLEKRYAKYVKDPSVNVQVVNKRVYALGELKNPQSIIIDRDIVTLFEVLSKCGGFTDSAQRDNVIIMSYAANGKATLRRVDLNSFKRVAMTNILVKPGDVIYVPPDGWKEYNLNANNYLSVLRTISQIAAPYLMLEDVFNWD